MDLLIGFVTGAIFATWLHYLLKDEQKMADSPVRSVVRDHFKDKPPKPDLKKARYYQSDEYRREKKFVERMKEGKLE